VVAIPKTASQRREFPPLATDFGIESVLLVLLLLRDVDILEWAVAAVMKGGRDCRKENDRGMMSDE
jgi:hypothetical protein